MGEKCQEQPQQWPKQSAPPIQRVATLCYISTSRAQRNIAQRCARFMLTLLTMFILFKLLYSPFQTALHSFSNCVTLLKQQHACLYILLNTYLLVCLGDIHVAKQSIISEVALYEAKHQETKYEDVFATFPSTLIVFFGINQIHKKHKPLVQGHQELSKAIIH